MLKNRARKQEVPHPARRDRKGGARIVHGVDDTPRTFSPAVGGPDTHLSNTTTHRFTPPLNDFMTEIYDFCPQHSEKRQKSGSSLCVQ